MPTIKELVSSTKVILYWKDFPSSQHRNKNIFRNTADDEGLLESSVARNYFEASHDKGQCDGIGGTAKHMADDAVKQRNVIIQDAYDFYIWEKQTQTGISCDFVSVKEE